MDLRDKIRSIIQSFKLDTEVERNNRRAITIWIRPEEKLKYDILQAKSQKSFSKLVQRVVRETIKSAESL